MPHAASQGRFRRSSANCSNQSDSSVLAVAANPGSITDRSRTTTNYPMSIALGIELMANTRMMLTKFEFTTFSRREDRDMKKLPIVFPICAIPAVDP